VKASDWPNTPIDFFVLARLESSNLSPSSEATRSVLIRRLSFDLTGLPPEPDVVRTFIADPDPMAYEKLVDRYLASPHYGERWARHWLDVVRFAESHGFETNLERKNAWQYRDYVIRSLNEDKPYDRFVLEQLAGDAAGADEATGFIVGGPWDAVKSPDINLTAQQRMDELHDFVATTASTFLSLTVGCARCHDHKFDPISQRDYYAMQGIFAGVQHGERPLRPPDYDQRARKAEELRARLAAVDQELLRYEPVARIGNSAVGTIRRPPVHPRFNSEHFDPVLAKSVRFTILETNNLEPCIDELEIYSTGRPSENVALASKGTTATASGTYPNSEIHKLEHVNDGAVGNSRSWISNEPGKGWVQLEFRQPTEIQRIVWSRDREQKYADRLAKRYKIEIATNTNDWRLIASSDDREVLRDGGPSIIAYATNNLPVREIEKLRVRIAEKEALEKKIQQLLTIPAVYAGRFDQPGATFRLHRGEPLQRREPVDPGAIRGLNPLLELPPETPEQKRRIALAEWLVHPDNPLPARSMVNRLWQYHFGRGLVETPSDFGRNGARPSHPELLDWLATEFRLRNWSIKSMHRLILLSNTYRQSSDLSERASAIDSDCHLLWRFPPHRIEAEPLRDSILWVSGNLDLTMGGPGFDLFQPNSNYVKVYIPKSVFGPQEWRRMIYLNKPRMRLDDTFGAFDCPDAGQIAPRRTSSITPLQALNLLNSPFTLQQATLFAERLHRDCGSNRSDQIARAFWLAFSRSPSAIEISAATELIEQHGLSAFCRAVFNSNEFVYVF
jgi:hypothetical protein